MSISSWGPNPGPQTWFCQSRAFEVLYGGSAGGGKALDIETPIPTPNGWEPMGALSAGDAVFDSNGNVCTVVACSELMKDRRCYELVFSDGERVVADAAHLWKTMTSSDRANALRRTAAYREKRRRSRPSRGTGKRPDVAESNRARTYTLLEPPMAKERGTAVIAATLFSADSRQGRINHSVPVAGPLQLPDIHSALDPYLLGLWLGDGSSYGQGFSTSDAELIEAFEQSGYAVSKWSGKYAYGVHGLLPRLRELGLLANKHIPGLYLRASMIERQALLQGLMDSDGYACPEKGTCEFTTTSNALAEGCHELILSLGIKANVKEGRATLYGKDCGPKYRIKFLTELAAFRLPRKLEKQKRDGFRGTHDVRYIVDVQEIDSVPVQCIAVDSPDRSYLAGRAMIPTHNSDALLGEGTRQVGNPKYRGVLFRRTFPELERAGGLIDRSQEIYPILQGEYGLGKRRWTFPSAAALEFGHMQRLVDRFQYDGAQFQYVAFDELTHFAESQYIYLFSRCRAPKGSTLRCYVRNGTNPGGVGHEWVKRRWGAWLDKEHPNPARAGELRFYAKIDDVDTEVEPGHPDARSRTFIPARVQDNPYLAGTDYERTLKALPLVERRRLLDGDWDIMPGRGLVFQRPWFSVVNAAPAKARRVRFWDLAATAKEKSGDDPDYTVGEKWAEIGGEYYVEHVVRMRATWGQVKKAIRQTAEADGPKVRIGVEQEPGAAGKALISEIVKHLAGFTVRGYPARGDKLVRAGPWAAQAEAGNVKLVNGPWVQAWLDECEWFPEGAHDDQVDAGSGAFGMLVKTGGVLRY